MNTNKNLIVVVGPTAIGKTELAIKLALHYQTEILSADSRQFYKEMSIGTAKPSADELAAVKHHFINSLSITQNFSVGDFEKEGLETSEHLFKNYNYVVLTGGSGLYIKAVTEGFDAVPKADMAVREELNSLFQQAGIEALQKRLKELDLEYYNEADINNPQRLIRALEVCISTGRPFSSFRQNKIRPRDFNIIKIGLNIDRDKLYSRINSRVDHMIEVGLIEEVKTLTPFKHLNALNTVGYSEIFEYLEGKISQQEAIESIKQNTRRFAKRQLTWFRRDKDIQWFEPSQFSNIIKWINEKSESGSDPTLIK